MSWLSPFVDDEKLGKKNDDHRPRSRMKPQTWASAPAQPPRRRRIVYLLCGALFVFLFIKNIPTDVGPHPRWADTRIYQGAISQNGNKPAPSPGTGVPSPPTKQPPRPPTPSESEQHYHDGPIKFYKLAASLHAVAKLGGQKDVNKNVLFAAASLKSVSELLPLACEMARWQRNDVHLAVMGRDDMELSEIQSLNGFTEADCSIHWHDARPDYSKWSTTFRMESSVAASLEHIQTFIHPQVVLIDDPKREEGYLVDAIREKAAELFKPLIELPLNAVENLMWITRLDSSSLAAWPKVYIDIVIQAPSSSSGSIVRLLRSLQEADYFGVRRPHLTIELPHEVDEPTARYLEYLVWPPLDWSGIPHASQVTLRHRIPRRTTTPEEASARLLESFWPKRRSDSHVLLLSPQVELSPFYFHYLFYNILEYRHSLLIRSHQSYRNLMGISLHLPHAHLDDTTTFIPPTSDNSNRKAGAFPGSQSPFLWQAPNENAALYFGDRWMEFHSYLSLRLTKPPSTSKKLVSEMHPAWLEHLLQFMRARGYSLLYPGAFFKDFSISTVHDELFQVPEEFGKEPKPPSTPDASLSSPDRPLEGNASAARKPPPNAEKPLLESSLVEILPNRGDLLEVDNMPYLSSDGTSLELIEAGKAAQAYANDFKRTVGGCKAGQDPPQFKPFQAVDLFCDPTEPFDYNEAKQPLYADASPSKNDKKAPVQDIASHDPDQISNTEALKAKQETALHLGRQSGEEQSDLSKLDTAGASKQNTLKDSADVKDARPSRKTHTDVENEKAKAVDDFAKQQAEKADVPTEKEKKFTRPPSGLEDDATDSKLSESIVKEGRVSNDEGGNGKDRGAGW